MDPGSDSVWAGLYDFFLKKPLGSIKPRVPQLHTQNIKCAQEWRNSPSILYRQLFSYICIHSPACDIWQAAVSCNGRSAEVRADTITTWVALNFLCFPSGPSKAPGERVHFQPSLSPWTSEQRSPFLILISQQPCEVGRAETVTDSRSLRQV